jgi:hypothetical protein
MLAVAGDTVTDATDAGEAATTARLANPLFPPAVAEMTAEPTATADSNPVADTVATLVLDDDHVTVWLASALPRESVGTAVNCTVFPGLSVTVEGVTLTAATWIVAAVAVAGIEVVSPPADALIFALPEPTSVTLPEVSTLATCVLDEAQVKVTLGIAWPF